MADSETGRDRGVDSVVLVHGLWMTGREMRVLGGRLGQAGFRPVYFRYRSWRGGIAKAARELRDVVEAAEGTRVHLVGHSLGGVVIARMLEEEDPARPGRVAMLGSPMAGSALGRKLARYGAGRWLMGTVAREGVAERTPRWPGERELLVVAGDLPLGTGMFLGIERPHDGMVRVEETRVEGARAVVVRASHVGLLLSRKVAALLCDHFRNAGPHPHDPA
ncbi:MAG TPA: alpha/beta hydrolase [Candidatus Deferrimicrobiaceae bacterium]